MKNRILTSSLVFILVLITALFASWLVLEERVVSYLAHVEIDPSQFETNLEKSLDVAEFDFSVIDELGLSGVMPYINEDVAPIGEIIIPNVDIHLPIFHGITEPHISLGAATLTPNQQMGQGNYSLASHYTPWGMLFGALDQVEMGDLIILRDDIYLYLYEATFNEVIEAYLVEIIEVVPEKTLITLITCTPDGLMRVAVQGEFIQQVLITDLMSEQITLNVEATPLELIPLLEIEVIQFPFFEVASAMIGSLMMAGLVTWLVSKKN